MRTWWVAAVAAWFVLGSACAGDDAERTSAERHRPGGKADDLSDGGGFDGDGADGGVHVKAPNVYIGNWMQDASNGTFDAAKSFQGWGGWEYQAFTTMWLGSRIIPEDWYRALRTADGRTLADASLLAEYGYERRQTASGDWPVGFYTNANAGYDPFGASLMHTCGACHVSTLRYQGSTVTVLGTAGRVDFDGYIRRIYQELADTVADPARWTAFSGTVPSSAVYYYLGGLKGYVENYLANAAAIRGTGAYTHLHPTASGPGRADVTGHLGIAFAMPPASVGHWPKAPPTTTPAAANPVSIPPIWGTHTHDYTHYTGAFRSPLVRDSMNAAAWNTEVHPPSDWNVDFSYGTYEIIEGHLIPTLESPAWPEAVFGPIDVPLAEAGHDLYEARCASCHGGTWTGTELALTYTDVDDVGTDPGAADYVMNARIQATWVNAAFADTSPLDVAAFVGRRMFEDTFAGYTLTDEQRTRLTGDRPLETRRIRAYKARPLDGIWATAPYLHNGSVQSLDELLRPQAERATEFWVSPHAEYDPKRVGFQSTVGQGFRFDTTLPGNSNNGHDYGTDLGAADRHALIEYLKTL